MKPTNSVILLCLLPWTVYAAVKPIELIVDTDIGEYPDDVGAFAMLHTYADRGLVDLKAMVASNAYEGIVPVIEAMNVYFGRPHIPIGITRDPRAFSSSGNLTWAQRVLAEYPHPTYRHNAQAEEGVALYRRILAAAPDGSITILSIGHFTNLANLLESQSDAYSTLSGRELVAKKVFRVVAMAGNFPTGFEWNIFKDLHAAQRFIDNIVGISPPIPCLFVGFELSHSRMLCGRGLLGRAELNKSPIKLAIEIASSIPEHFDGCYDEMATYVLVEGYEKYYCPIYGQIEVLNNGTNIWHGSDDRTHSHMSYLVAKDRHNDAAVLRDIENLMAR